MGEEIKVESILDLKELLASMPGDVLVVVWMGEEKVDEQKE